MWPNQNQPNEESSKSSNLDETTLISHNDDVRADENSIRVKPVIDRDRDKESQRGCPVASSYVQSIRRRSASRDSSLNDDPKSLVDSISTASGRQIWSKEMAEDDPSVGSIKGDSISATIADYDRKHRVRASDNQSRTSVTRLGQEGDGICPRTDDLSSNINFYSASGSTGGGICGRNRGGSSKAPGDITSVSSNANADAFDLIEESSNVSRDDNLSQSASSNHHSKRHEHIKHYRTSSLEQALDIDDLPQVASIYQIEPIILRGNGNLTLFGLSNSFSAEFPSALIGRVSREEFDRTMRRINSLLRDQQSLSAKLLLFGGLCCCCSLGFSLVWPSIALKKRSKMCIEKFLASENSRLYSKLGLNWKLAEQRCYSNHAFVEYVLFIEFTPKIDLYLPD